MGNSWEDFKKTFPWKAMVIGFLIPKIIFFIGISVNMLFPGAILAISWCLSVFIATHLRDSKVDIFATLAVVMILLRIVVVLASKSPKLYLIAQALDYGSCGVFCFISLLLPRSLIQLFAEESGIVMPDVIRNSPYYVKAWRIITVVWGAVFMIIAGILIMLRMGNLGSVAIVDMFAGWVSMIILIAFTVIFPRRYWTRKIGLAAVQSI